MKLIDKKNIKPMEWGNHCESWQLLDKENMGVFHEKMPPNSADVLHKHQFSEQFLYVLHGTVGIVINTDTHYLSSGQGIVITKEVPHKIFNDSKSDVEFILFASPSHRNDRIEIEQ